LWRRHGAYGFAVAQGLAPEDDWEAISARAWVHILDSRDDDEAAAGFRPYLYLVIRAVASTSGRTGTDALLTTAYYRLPRRWREVLWYGHAELMKPAQMGRFLGVDPGEVPAVLHRAREGLRQEWVRGHVDGAPEDSFCRTVWERSGAYLHGDLSDIERTWILNHVRTCQYCRTALSDVVKVAAHLRTTVLPAVAGVGGAASLVDYLRTNGPCVRTPLPLPQPVADLFSAEPGQPAESATEPTPRPRPALRPVPAEPLSEPKAEPAVPPAGVARHQLEEDSPRPNRRRVVLRAIGILIVILLILAGIIGIGLAQHPGPTGDSTSPPATQAPSPAATPTSTGTPGPGAAQIVTVDTGRLNNLFPVVAGTAAPNSTITVHIGETVFSVLADQQGNWTTANVNAEFLDTRGVVTASSNTNPESTAVLYDIADPPSLTVDVQGTQAVFTVTGLPGASANLVVDGAVTATVRLDASGTSKGQLPLTSGSHFIQVRHADLDRFGPSSVPVVLTVP